MRRACNHRPLPRLNATINSGFAHPRNARLIDKRTVATHHPKLCNKFAHLPCPFIIVTVYASSTDCWIFLMQIGYARISTDDQSLDLQCDALRSAGCDKVFEDTMSGAKAERPGLRQALGHLRDGDTLVVWRLDRLGRSLKDLIVRAEELKGMGIGLKSLQESIDTASSGGKLIFHMFGALAEFERNLMRERTNAGLSAARARGRKGGRKKVLDVKQRAHAVELYKSRKHTVKEISALMGISRQTLYHYVEEFTEGP
tara:strand:- start:3437 stop:4207 length:771 start_codon:yes stop_codon:yes gene_type:complete